MRKVVACFRVDYPMMKKDGLVESIECLCQCVPAPDQVFFVVFLYSQWRLRRLPLRMHLPLSSHISTYCNYDFYLDQYLHNNKNVRFEALSVYIICIYELLTNMKSYDFREPWTCCPESTRSSDRRSIGTPSSGRINKAWSFFCLYWILKSFLVSIFFFIATYIRSMVSLAKHLRLASYWVFPLKSPKPTYDIFLALSDIIFSM